MGSTCSPLPFGAAGRSGRYRSQSAILMDAIGATLRKYFEFHSHSRRSEVSPA
jgi:hypothetical protein